MSLNITNNITSLYVSGISPGTKEKYIRSIFSKLGQVHKINYHEKTTAHVHMRCWYSTNERIEVLANKIKNGEMVPIVHDVIYYWTVGLFNTNTPPKNITMRKLHEFAEKNGIRLQTKPHDNEM